MRVNLTDLNKQRLPIEQKKRSKYNAVKTKIDGITFDSAREADRYCELKLLQKAHEISGLELQPVFELQPEFVYDGKKEQAITYIADFAYLEENGHRVVEDVKGTRTKEFNIKRKMLLYTHPDIDFRLIF